MTTVRDSRAGCGLLMGRWPHPRHCGRSCARPSRRPRARQPARQSCRGSSSRIGWHARAAGVGRVGTMGPGGHRRARSRSPRRPGIMLSVLVSAIGAGSAAFSAAEDRRRDRAGPARLSRFGRIRGRHAVCRGHRVYVTRGILGLHPDARDHARQPSDRWRWPWRWGSVRDTTRVLFDHAERRGAQAAQARAALANARIAALQARMQPHFLFNALNTVAELVDRSARGRSHRRRSRRNPPRLARGRRHSAASAAAGDRDRQGLRRRRAAAPWRPACDRVALRG